MSALDWSQASLNDKENGTGPYMTCIYALRFDRIVAEIKLMLYRVSRSPSRFPWPADMSRWQIDVDSACQSLIDEARNRQQIRATGAAESISVMAAQKLQIKYHQCLMLLYRPSPQIPRPSRDAAKKCLNSAVKIICISADLHRFKKMDFTWLSAHSIFVAAITVFYYHWVSPEETPAVGSPNCLETLVMAQELLQSLSEIWYVAKEACQKLANLIPIVSNAQSSTSGHGPPAAQRYPATNEMQSQGLDMQYNVETDNNMEYWPYQGVNALVDELGIMREFFDLGWLDNVNLDPLPLS